MISPRNIEVVDFQHRPIELGAQLGQRFRFHLLVDLNCKQNLVIRIRLPDPRDDLCDGRFGTAQIKSLDLIERGAPRWRYKDDDRLTASQMMLVQYRLVIAMHQVDRPVEHFNVPSG